MGEPIRTSTADIPDFSTYPAAPSDHLISAHASSLSQPSFQTPDRGIPPSLALHDTASEVGRRLGESVNVLRDARDRAWERIDAVRGTANELLDNLRTRSTDFAQAKFDAVREQSRAQALRAKHYAEARPLAVIAAAGVAGLLLGAGARAWRERRG